MRHTPVLVEAVVRVMMTGQSGLFIDGTVGTGGHSAALLESGPAGMSLLGIDRDPAALDEARTRLAPYGDRVTLVQGDFAEVERIAGGRECRGILLDLGISSLQIADRRRGFSYLEDGPLDMAMGPGGRSVADLLGTAGEAEIARVIREYGEERGSRRIAAEIVRERRRGPIERTGRLREAVERVSHPARIIPTLARVFQALRIWANRELEALQAFLPQALRLCVPGGRIAIISYHSLEDRMVKQFFRGESQGCQCPPDFPRCICGRTPTLRLLTRRPLTPDAAEKDSNPRARSARLRAAERM
ncbi:MAG: 16S rRNA (cytosine(1402)-N(4))-methyltransferase RsmH [Candidatus Krumholzibacteria bacterium]|nr:16S rRNA (cytosine(1402)-N(4))-methyltransferase RsmH [Candidatus Krumholzibacteria bacterium]